MSIHPKVAKLVTLISQAASGCQVFTDLEIPLKAAANTISRDPLAAQYVMSVIGPYTRVLKVMMGLGKGSSPSVSAECRVPKEGINTLYTFDSTYWRIIAHSAEMVTALLQAGCKIDTPIMLDLSVVFAWAAVAAFRKPPIGMESATAASGTSRESSAAGSTAKSTVVHVLPVAECVVILLKQLHPSKGDLHAWVAPQLAATYTEKTAAIAKKLEEMGQFDGLCKVEHDDDEDEGEDEGEVDDDSAPVNESSGIDAICSTQERHNIAELLTTMATFIAVDVKQAPELRPAGAVLNACVDLTILASEFGPNFNGSLTVKTLSECAAAAIITAGILTRKLPASQELVQDCCMAARRALIFLADLFEQRCKAASIADIAADIAYFQSSCLCIFASVPSVLATLQSWHTAVLEANESGEGSGTVRKDGRARLLPASHKQRIIEATAANTTQLNTDSPMLSTDSSVSTPTHDFVVRGVTTGGGKAILASIHESMSLLLAATFNAYEMSTCVHTIKATPSSTVSATADATAKSPADSLPSTTAESTLLTTADLRKPDSASRLVAACAAMEAAGTVVDVHFLHKDDGIEGSSIVAAAKSLCAIWAVSASGSIPDSCSLPAFLNRNPEVLSELVLAMLRSSLIRSRVSANFIGALSEAWATLAQGTQQLKRYSPTMQRILLMSLRNAAYCWLLAHGVTSDAPLPSPSRMKQVVGALLGLIEVATDPVIIVTTCSAITSVLRVVTAFKLYESDAELLEPVTALASQLVGAANATLNDLRGSPSITKPKSKHSRKVSDDEDAAMASGVEEFLAMSAALTRLQSEAGAISKLSSAEAGTELRINAERFVGALRASVAAPVLFEDDAIIVAMSELLLEVLST